MVGFFDSVINFLYILFGAFGGVIDWLQYDLNTLIDTLYGWIPVLGTAIVDALTLILDTISIGEVRLGDISLLVLMCGGGLFFYIIYQLGKWLIPIIE